MRALDASEIGLVSGAGAGCGEENLLTSTCGCPCPTPEPGKTKNNNGYGNGAESGPPPGNSGAHNPQLLTANSGPRGPR